MSVYLNYFGTVNFYMIYEFGLVILFIVAITNFVI